MNNDEVYLSITENNFLMIVKFICCSIGIPLNVSIAISIIRHRQLRRQPSNIFLLGIILSYVSFFVPSVIELLYWSFYPIESLCRAYVAVVAAPHALLLLNILLALVDKYVAIKYPSLHKDKMTISLACGIVSISSISTVFLMKFVYVIGLTPLRCELGIFQIKMMAIILTILFVPFTALTIIVYRQLKSISNQSRTPSPTTMFDDAHMAVVDIGNVEWIELATSANAEVQNKKETTNNSVVIISEHSTIVRSMSIHLNREIVISEADKESVKTLIIGVTPVVVMAYCGIIFLSKFFACRLFGRFQCEDLSWMAPYIKDLSLMPAFYSSVIFLTRNKELRSANKCQNKSEEE